MTTWNITIFGQPAGMPRARSVRTKWGGIRHYIPQKSPGVVYRSIAAKLSARKPKLEGPVRVTIGCVFEMPKSWTKAKKLKHDGQPHTQKPDSDNIAKAILDGLSECWPDDAVVWELIVRKVWGQHGSTVVFVTDTLTGDYTP
jgi:Holliday junction resolvase RusA-like endonuclease